MKDRILIKLLFIIIVIAIFLSLNFMGDKYKEIRLKEIEIDICRLYCFQGLETLTNQTTITLSECLLSCDWMKAKKKTIAVGKREIQIILWGLFIGSVASLIIYFMTNDPVYIMVFSVCTFLFNDVVIKSLNSELLVLKKLLLKIRKDVNKLKEWLNDMWILW